MGRMPLRDSPFFRLAPRWCVIVVMVPFSFVAAVPSAEFTVGISPRSSMPIQDLQDRMKKEAKKEMEERGALERDEALAAREDEEYQV